MSRYHRLVMTVVVVMSVAACGGSSSGPSAVGPVSSNVVERQSPGQAFASVDGMEFRFDQPGALDCTVSPEAITFSFRIGDNEVTLGGGANNSDEGWFGGIDLRIANPAGEEGPLGYFPDFPDGSAGVAIDGASMSYSGPMLKQVPNDGTNPPPVDVGEGTISLTCP